MAVWSGRFGGQIAEDGVKLDPQSFDQRAKSELSIVLPGVDLQEVEWSTYSVDRAEGANRRRNSTRIRFRFCALAMSRPAGRQNLCWRPSWRTKLPARASSPYLAMEFGHHAVRQLAAPRGALLHGRNTSVSGGHSTNAPQTTGAALRSPNYALARSASERSSFRSGKVSSLALRANVS